MLFLLLTSFTVCHTIHDYLFSTEFLILLIGPGMFSDIFLAGEVVGSSEGKFVVSEEDGCNICVFTLCCFLAKFVRNKRRMKKMARVEMVFCE